MQTSCFYGFQWFNLQIEWIEKIFRWLLMIWKNLKRIWSVHVQEMKCNQVQKKENLTALTPIGILTTSWPTSIRLKWLLNHFEANT